MKSDSHPRKTALPSGNAKGKQESDIDEEKNISRENGEYNIRESREKHGRRGSADRPCSRERAHAAAPALPPGPRMPSALQAVGWTWRSLPFMERCQRRYGDMFTLRIRHGGTWVLLCDPEDVKRVFTAEPEHAGCGRSEHAAGARARPALGDAAGGAPAHGAPQAHAPPVPRPAYGELRRDDRRGGAAGGRSAGRSADRSSCGRACRRSPWRRSCASSSEQCRPIAEASARAAARADRLDERPAAIDAAGRARPRSMVGDPEFRGAMERVEAAVLEEVRKARAQGEARAQGDGGAGSARTSSRCSRTPATRTARR